MICSVCFQAVGHTGVLDYVMLQIVAGWVIWSKCLVIFIIIDIRHGVE